MRRGSGLKARGLPCHVHATGTEDWSTFSRRGTDKPTYVRGAYASTALIEENIAPRMRASSPPRDHPRTATKSLTGRTFFRSHHTARSEYSIGISRKDWGRPGARCVA